MVFFPILQFIICYCGAYLSQYVLYGFLKSDEFKEWFTNSLFYFNKNHYSNRRRIIENEIQW